MGLLSWVGRAISLRDGEFWSRWFGGETWAGEPVNESNSLNYGPWWRCVRIYADVVGAMPLKFYERKDSDERVQNRDHPVATLIGLDPNKEQTSQEFWSSMAASLAMLGNSYAEKRYVGKSLAALELLPLNTCPDRSRTNDYSLRYYYTDRGKEEWLPPDKVLHIRGFNLGKSDVGLSPLSAARQGLSIALATEKSAGKTFSQGLRASGFFTGPKLTPDQRSSFVKTFIDPIIGNDASAHYGILENGFEFQPINIPPKDAEMLLSRRFNVEEICRFMGVPPIIVGHAAEGQTMWGCLLGDALVSTERGPRPIRDVQVGERVWSHRDGKMVLRRVLRSGCTGRKPVMTIKSRDRSLEATANHEFFIRRKFSVPKPGPGGYRAVEWRNVWARADEITTDDYLILAHGHGAATSSIAPNGRVLTKQFMEVCGLYVAEGSMNERAVVIARADDAPYMPAYRDAIGDSFVKADGSTVTVREQVRSTAFSSVLAVSELRELGFGGVAATKRVPGWVFGLDRSLILAFLRGYLDGDGTVNRRGWIAWTSINRALIEDVRHLCMLCGIPVGEACGYPITYGFGDRPRRLPGMVWQAWSFSVVHNREIGSHDPRYVERWALAAASERVGRFDPEYVGRGKGGARPGLGFDIEGAIISRVVAIESGSNQEFAVYDIEVEGTHNFVANGIVVHNSGVEAIINQWLTSGLNAFLTTIEKAINKRLLTNGERQRYYAEFERDALLRTDSAARAEFISKMIQNAQMTPNEGRKTANRLPLPGGDVLLVNSTLVPLTQAGDRPARVQPAPGEPALEPMP